MNDRVILDVNLVDIKNLIDKGYTTRQIANEYNVKIFNVQSWKRARAALLGIRNEKGE